MVLKIEGHAKMKFKYLIIAAGLGLLGFLFYPRSEEVVSLSDFYFISPAHILEKEEPHYPSIRRSDPLVTTFDLGYVYKFNQAIVPFKNPVERGPKRYSILVSCYRKKGYSSAYDYAATSSEYPIPIQRFSNPVEGRWLQIIVDDWFGKKPELKTDEFRVGIQYENPTLVRSISSKYNKRALDKLTDLIVSENSKWIAAKRITKEIEEEGKKKTEISFSSSEDDIIVTFDLGNIIPIHGTRLTTDGPGNNLKRYEISVSVDGSEYTTVYVSSELEDKTVADLWSAETKSPYIRYVRLKINKGDWYGDYPEIRELEFFTGNYKLPPEQPHDINKYNARQVYYDDCGRGNERSLNMVQGFPFDRGTDDENRYFYPEEELEPGNTERQRSFCYHYDTIVFRYTNLVSSALYWVQVTYLQSKARPEERGNGNRVQSLDVDGYILHGSELEIPKGKAKTYTFSIPKSAYADGEFELHFHRLAGINAVVSEVGIFEAHPQSVPLTKAVTTRALSKAPQVSTPVKIDGSLEEWPALYPLIPSKFHGKPGDFPLKFYLQWDKGNLYLGAEINRAAMKKSRNRSGVALSRQEIANLLGKLNIFVDTITNRSPGIYKTTDHHLLFYQIGSRKYKDYSKAAQIHHHLDAISANIPDRKEIEYVQNFTKTGYTLEARIPGNDVLHEFNPQVGKTIGFNYILSNRLIDDIGWAMEKIDAPPSQWGTVELVSKVSGQIMVMDEAGENSLNSFDAGDSVIVSIWDADRNIDRGKIETVDVELRGNITNDKEELTLTESDPLDYQQTLSSDLFAFKLPTSYSTEPIEGDKILQVVGNEIVTLTYIDPYYAPDQKNKELNIDLKVNVGADGKIIIAKESGGCIDQFRAGDTLIFEIRDPDLLKAGKPESRKAAPRTTHHASRLEIELKVRDSDEIEKVSTMPAVKSEQEDENFPLGTYIGSIKTEYATEPTPLDGVLQVAGTQRVIATYIDEIQETGQTDVPVTAEAKVEVGNTGTLSIDHGEGITVDQGETSFATPRLKFSAGTELQLRLKDTDLNSGKPESQKAGKPDNRKAEIDAKQVSLLQSEIVKDTVEITSNGNILNDKLKIILKETGKSTGEFVGVCKTKYATGANPENDLLEIKGNEEVTFAYIDALQGTGATKVPVKLLTKVNVGENGTLTIVQSDIFAEVEKFNAGDLLYFRLQDADESGKIELTVTGNQTNDKESVELYPTSPTSGTFLGSIKTEYRVGQPSSVPDLPRSFLRGRETSPLVGETEGDEEVSLPIDDGVLQVQGNEKVIAVYIDKLRSTGETNVSVSDSAIVNTGYTGRLTVYKKGDMGQLPSASDLPRPFLRGRETYPLVGGTEGDEEVSLPTDTIGEQIDRFKAGETLILELEDLDLSRTSAVAELVETDSSEDIVRDNIRVSMREVSGNAGVFRGEIRTEYSEEAIVDDNILQVQGLGIVTFSYVDALQKTGKTQVPISAQLTVEIGEKGSIEIYAADGRSLVAGSNIGTGSFSAGDTLIIKLSDNDLNVDVKSKDSAKVTVVGNLLQDELLLRLSETEDDSGVFEGKLLTEYRRGDSASSPYDIADEILQVTDKEVVSVKYLDQILATGETNVLVEAKAIVLSSNPGVLFIVDENDQELGSFNTGRIIHFWLKDLLLSTVDATIKPTVTVSGDKTNDLVTVTLDKVLGEEGLFRGSITTRYGTTPIYDDTLDVQGDEEITASYQPDFPGVYSLQVEDTAYVNKGNRGQILIVKNDGTPVYNFNSGAKLYFRLEDSDLNKDPFDIDYADIWVSTEIGSGRTAVSSIGNYVSLTEEGKNSGIFVGSLKTQRGRSAQSIGVLGLVGGEIVKATYVDELTDTGEANVDITDTCRANLIGWATYAKEEVIVDGIPDKWPMETVLETEQDEALMWVQWDRDNLYILAQIYDDEVVVTDPIKWYEGGTDAIELHIDLNPDEVEKPSHLRKADEENEFVFWLCPKGGGFEGRIPYAGQDKPDSWPNYPHIEIGVKYHVEDPKPFYILEATIPFNLALKGFDPIKTTRIDKIGFNYVIYRSDAPIVQWAKPVEGSGPVQPSKLGTLYLERP